MNIHAASGVAQSKKVRVRVLGRGTHSKSWLQSPNEPAYPRLEHWWMYSIHHKLAHCHFPSVPGRMGHPFHPLEADPSLTLRSQPSRLPLWLVLLLLLGGDIHPNPGPQTHPNIWVCDIWVCDICHKPITKRQVSVLCNYTKHWVHLKCTQITAKDHNKSWCCMLHNTPMASPQPTPTELHTNTTA